MPQGQYNNTLQSLLPGQVQPFQLDQSGRVQITEEGLKYCYRACTIAQTFYSTAAAVMFEIVGSATMTIRIKKITVWAQCATKFYAELTLGRATAVSGSGGATALTAGKNDKNDPAATATINYYTAAAVSGAGFAVMGGKILGLAAPSASMIAQPCIWDFCINNEKPLILRGTGDVLEIYNNTTALGTGTFGFDVLWEEDNS
ncbi:MAG: hypothetical protein ACLQBD_26725 [Syntrophobacteraceae bacterium]